MFAAVVCLSFVVCGAAFYDSSVYPEVRANISILHPANKINSFPILDMSLKTCFRSPAPRGTLLGCQAE